MLMATLKVCIWYPEMLFRAFLEENAYTMLRSTSSYLALLLTTTNIVKEIIVSGSISGTSWFRAV